MLNVSMLSVVMLNAIMLNVVAPLLKLSTYLQTEATERVSP
jgi:hypothetical protein